MDLKNTAPHIRAFLGKAPTLSNEAKADFELANELIGGRLIDGHRPIIRHLLHEHGRVAIMLHLDCRGKDITRFLKKHGLIEK